MACQSLAFVPLSSAAPLLTAASSMRRQNLVDGQAALRIGGGELHCGGIDVDDVARPFHAGNVVDDRVL
jgi:hypothetical protein